jgi:hypothetical protein
MGSSNANPRKSQSRFRESPGRDGFGLVADDEVSEEGTGVSLRDWLDLDRRFNQRNLDGPGPGRQC